MNDPEHGSGQSGKMSRRSRNWLIACFIIFDVAVAVLIIAFFLQM